MQHRLLQHIHCTNILQNIHAYSTVLYKSVIIFVGDKSSKVCFCTDYHFIFCSHVYFMNTVMAFRNRSILMWHIALSMTRFMLLVFMVWSFLSDSRSIYDIGDNTSADILFLNSTFVWSAFSVLIVGYINDLVM